MLNKIHKSWYPITNLLYQEPLKTLNEKVLPEISYQPTKENIFRIFQMPVEKIKVVILGQDPYPKPGDAIGYAFAINKGRKFPVSLKNIIKEVKRSDPDNINPSGEIDLTSWVNQGVFLLNTALTVETGRAGSHLKYWENFTKRVISHISVNNPTIWVFWGKKAQKFIPYIHINPFHVVRYNRETIEKIPINSHWNYVLKGPHPAAEAYLNGKAGFFGCDHFYFINRILEKKRIKKIIW